MRRTLLNTYFVNDPKTLQVKNQSFQWLIFEIGGVKVQTLDTKEERRL
jgi:hypothetical protein